MSYTSIDSFSGRRFQLEVADVDVSPSSYATIGGLRVTGMTLNQNPVDISSVSGGGWREWDPDGGIFDASISISGIFDSRTTGAQSLYQAARERVLIDCRVISGHGDTLYMTCAVNSFERTGNHDDVEQFSCTLNSHGPIQFK